MSEIKVDTLTGKTTANDITVTVGATATMSLEQGLAKAWFNFTGRGTAALVDDFGITSLTDNGTGSFNLSYTANMSNSTYSFSNGQGWDVGTTNSTTSGTDKDFITTSSLRVLHVNMADSAYDPDVSFGSVHGDLA